MLSLKFPNCSELRSYARAVLHDQNTPLDTDKNPQLVESLSDRFADNFLALVQYQPDVASQVYKCLPQSLALFITPKGHINIVDLPSDEPVYGDNPLIQCQAQIKKVLSETHFSTATYVNQSTNPYIHYKYVCRISDIYQDARERLIPRKQVSERLEGVYLFGLGLGYHLELLFESVELTNIFLCEPNLDWFVASLFCIDWLGLLEALERRNGYIYLHIGRQQKSFFEGLVESLGRDAKHQLVGAMFYQHYPSAELAAAMKQFDSQYSQLMLDTGFFDDGIIALAHHYANGQKNLPYLSKSKSLPQSLLDVPIFVVANGPSIDQVIDNLVEHQDKGLILCCGTALEPLLAKGIMPDFLFEVERTNTSTHYFNHYFDKAVLKSLNLFTTPLSHPACLDLFKWVGVGLKPNEPSTFIDKECSGSDCIEIKYCNPVVANMAMSFSCFAGFNKVLLFGVDCGYKDPDYHHSKNSFYYDDHAQTHQQRTTNSVRVGEVEQEGNFAGQVWCSNLLFTSKTNIEKLLAEFPSVDCINCSDGVKINGSRAQRADDILTTLAPLQDKEKIVEAIKSNLFKPYSFDKAAFAQRLQIEPFEKLCDRLSHFICEENLAKCSNRHDMARLLMRQQAHLYQLKNGEQHHFYQLLSGTFHAVHIKIRLLLTCFDDEQQTLNVTKKALAELKQLLAEAKVNYRDVLQQIDQQRCYWL